MASHGKNVLIIREGSILKYVEKENYGATVIGC